MDICLNYCENYCEDYWRAVVWTLARTIPWTDSCINYGLRTNAWEQLPENNCIVTIAFSLRQHHVFFDLRFDLYTYAFLRFVASQAASSFQPSLSFILLRRFDDCTLIIVDILTHCLGSVERSIEGDETMTRCTYECIRNYVCMYYVTLCIHT